MLVATLEKGESEWGRRGAAWRVPRGVWVCVRVCCVVTRTRRERDGELSLLTRGGAERREISAFTKSKLPVDREVSSARVAARVASRDVRARVFSALRGTT